MAVVLLLILAACASPNGADGGTAEIEATNTVDAALAAAVSELPAAADPATSEPLPTPSLNPAVTAVMPTSADVIHFAADDERIRYIGRFDFQDPKRPRFDWSASTIEFAFDGTGLAIFLEDEYNLYNVTVDGRSEVLDTEAGQERYVIAEGLAPGEHFFRMVKRTEPIVGEAAFGGVEITGEGLLTPPMEAGRRIEFIGDSITTGFGNEGESPECFFTAATQNAEKTYAAMVAAELDADYSLIALSGLGVYYPLQAQGVSSSDTAIEFIDRALAFEPEVTWPPEQQTPDAVVISLGTNDYSADPNPEDEAYIEVYLELLNAVRVRYPEAFVFAVAGPLVFGQGPEMIETAVERFRAANGDERAAYVFIEDDLERSEVDFGCAWHPNVHGQQKIAAQLTPAIAGQMGW